ncbi:MAG: NAD(P)/FAD-dependent oxidoreductase [Chthoniobacterales bacterium]
MKDWDVTVIGGGPAGSTVAALTAKAGLKTLLIDRAVFPREKVCGDCLNPGCWEVFDRLGVATEIAGLPSARLEWVAFTNLRGRRVEHRFPNAGPPETGIRRSVLDHALLKNAEKAGAEIWQGEPVTGVERRWLVKTGRRQIRTKFLVAADGRNSSVARFLGVFPKTRTDRVAHQTYFSADRPMHIALELNSLGYMGIGTVGRGAVNLCIVARPKRIEELRLRISRRFGLAPDHRWNTVAPLSRRPVETDDPTLFYVGDAARVVEPFTGEGIFYALKSGLLAAESIVESNRKGPQFQHCYAERHRQLYTGRLWINQLARLSVLHPGISSTCLELLRFWPWPLDHLTRRVVG